MIKVVGLLKRRADLTHAQFSDYWFHNHHELGARVVPREALSRKYVQNHALAMKGGGEAPYDAVAELYFDDRAHMQRWIDWYNSDAGKVLRDDELNFMDITKRVVIVTDERILRDD
jgi:uncharacterized protein (TIGR02118 family)